MHDLGPVNTGFAFERQFEELVREGGEKKKVTEKTDDQHIGQNIR